MLYKYWNGWNKELFGILNYKLSLGTVQLTEGETIFLKRMEELN